MVLGEGSTAFIIGLSIFRSNKRRPNTHSSNLLSFLTNTTCPAHMLSAADNGGGGCIELRV